MSNAKRLCQHFTPDWAALELVERFFGDLDAGDMVIEPSCGRGAFLRALPASVPALGVEIDPDVAAEATRTSGRKVVVGDFRMVDLPQATAIIGNPPFSVDLVQQFLDRAWHLLPTDGRVGFILPCYVLQTASTVDRLAQHWSMRQHLIPRNLFGRINHPLCFVQLTKGITRGLVGFALFGELHAVNQLQARYRQLLANGEGSVWTAVVRAALEVLDGRAQLQKIYREIEGHRPTSNTFWQAKVRQTLQRIAVRVGEATWALPERVEAAA